MTGHHREGNENVKVAFKVLPDGKEVPVGHQHMNCHMVFDLKIDCVILARKSIQLSLTQAG